ncbi:MAG TPA: hypothetical protein VE974_29230 [Thermoanaerobaculia bacterium]|nr:hypothetical protein [Thermoanaerobaculia bacterium]
MNWDALYVVSDSLALRISSSGRLVSQDGHELTEDALPVLTSFATPSTPRAVLAKLQESWELDEPGFETLVDALLHANLLRPAPAPQRDLYLVLGLNRSGTSALTKALAACGVALDFDHPALPLGLFKPDTSRADGGYESYEILPVLMLVREITARHGGDQNKPVLTDEIALTATDTLAIRALLESIPRFPFAIKDPLLTFQYPQWKEIARACRQPIIARPVVTLRHPVTSAHALLKRGFCSTLRSALDQWLRYYTEVKYLLDAGEEPLIVVYDGQKDRFVRQIEALCGMLSLPFDRDRVSAEFVPAGVDRPDRAELRQHPLGNTLQELFEELETRAVRR